MNKHRFITLEASGARARTQLAFLKGFLEHSGIRRS